MVGCHSVKGDFLERYPGRPQVGLKLRCVGELNWVHCLAVGTSPREDWNLAEK